METCIIFVTVGFLVQLVIAVNIEPTPRPPCCTRSHELYTTCGSACPLTCDNYNHPPVCTMQCVAGCFCEPGYVKNKVGNCILSAECPQVSQPNCTRSHEVYTNCGTACPLTCNNYENPTVCTKQCIIGCVCKAGYVKNTDGTCCLPADCKPKGCVS